MGDPVVIVCDGKRRNNHRDEVVDYYELFCAQAGRGRKLSSADEFGGSLPILKYQAVKGATRPPLAKEARCNSSDLLSVPESPHLRRAHSDLGADEQHQYSVDPNRESLIASCKQKLKNSKPVSLRLWSSFRSLVESCDNPSMCLSPESPPYDRQLNTSSAPHSRSSSIKKKKHRKPRTHNSADSADSNMRPRLSSMPSKNGSQQSEKSKHASMEMEDSFRVRNFITTPRGIVNCGDSFRSVSTTSIRSLVSCESTGQDSYGSASSLVGEANDCPPYKVLILGSHGVGKTTLAQQLLTSECIVEKQSLHAARSPKNGISAFTKADILCLNDRYLGIIPKQCYCAWKCKRDRAMPE
ncbi:hypothetical protein CAPTEDRAFT_216336 [Capitella teleta]|uniref:Uncharacterized protein n=1 Tax=Capitella teleta TaxID=283909 RepID=R7T5J2_CAPTE|nr:hypothetical protein CAPTEDRAFT_216336 [Capitella teleta]|eukprot:ELT88624.1 hypothetical protein CAPTEDRAFT_216336 [Capitella teleta]